MNHAASPALELPQLAVGREDNVSDRQHVRSGALLLTVAALARRISGFWGERELPSMEDRDQADRVTTPTRA